MTSSRRSMVAAIVLFVLIAVAVIGSMSWATVASFELAKQNVSEEHRTRVEGALRQIESHMMGIVNSEAARPFWDYFDRYEDRPDIVELDDGRQLDPDRVTVQLPSPLARKLPPYPWMDLHFQISPQGALGSPQIPDAATAWPVESTQFTPEYSKRARLTWKWFERVCPSLDIQERIANAFRQERSGDDSATGGHGDAQTAIGGRRAEGRPDWLRGVAASKFGGQTLTSAQKGYLPAQECVHPDVAAQNIRSLMAGRLSKWEIDSSHAEHVTLTAGQFAPAFWVEPEGSGPPKLAFVRDFSVDAALFYQGFIGDWGILEAELLDEIDRVFPEADLEPIANDAHLDAEDQLLKLPYVPALLRVPGIPGGVEGAAWASIRWRLLTSWAAAAAVLVVAGFGVRNLVALTNRRMQFAYAVTHELRTPLTTFRLYSDMLSAGLVPDSARQEYLDTLNRESVRLSRLVEEVLEYARLENQKLSLHLTQTDAPSLLRAIGETLDKVCRQNGIEGRTSTSMTNGNVLRTDVNLVNQIAGVLVNNACRHARDSAHPLVFVELGNENGRLHLDVIDSGAGVDRADSRRIFKPFRRGRDADRAARGGIGLGLALARNWAGLLGGRLDLVSRRHPQYHGAHFRLTVPADSPNP